MYPSPQLVCIFWKWMFIHPPCIWDGTWKLHQFFFFSLPFNNKACQLSACISFLCKMWKAASSVMCYPILCCRNCTQHSHPFSQNIQIDLDFWCIQMFLWFNSTYDIQEIIIAIFISYSCLLYKGGIFVISFRLFFAWFSQLCHWIRIRL